MTHHAADHSELAAAWVRGWAVSRRTSEPAAVPGGFRIEIGSEKEQRRTVFGDWDAETLREFARAWDEPRHCVKIMGPAAELAAALPEKWTVFRDDHLMTVELNPARVVLPEGFRVAVESEGERSIVRVFGSHGELAGSAQLGTAGRHAIFDRVETRPEHRRKGLGRAMMAALTDRARETGARTGVLVASEDGKALYEQLGWTKRSDVPAAAVLE